MGSNVQKKQKHQNKHNILPQQSRGTTSNNKSLKLQPNKHINPFWFNDYIISNLVQVYTSPENKHDNGKSPIINRKYIIFKWLIFHCQCYFSGGNGGNYITNVALSNSGGELVILCREFPPPPQVWNQTATSAETPVSFRLGSGGMSRWHTWNTVNSPVEGTVVEIPCSLQGLGYIQKVVGLGIVKHQQLSRFQYNKVGPYLI